MARLCLFLILSLIYFQNVASNQEELDIHLVINEMKKDISKMKDLEAKVAKMDDLESRVAKLEDLARVGTLRTCSEYSKYGISTNGMYVVDPDGPLNGEEPFEVFCNFTDGSTQVHHDAESLMEVTHCHDPGCFNKIINYRGGVQGPLIPLSQLEALITLSDTCSQEFVYQCFLAPLKSEGVDFAFWEDRTGEINYYFTGSNKNFHSCGCYFTDEGCEDEETKGNTCACDANLPVPLEDTGVITNKTALPIMKINFGGLQYPSQTAKFLLGPLKCVGKAHFEEGNSCSALKKEGVMRSGLYNIMKDGASHTSLVHCDMTGDGYENVPETDEISSSSPLGTIAAWVSKPTTEDAEISAIPAGWQRCDGTVITPPSIWAGKYTPDLNSAESKRFLRGGPDKDMLKKEDDQLQDHEHVLNDPGHTHGYYDRYTNAACGADEGPDGRDYIEDSYDCAISYITGSEHTGITVKKVSSARSGTETRPKNMNVIFIIRIW